jgi:hypothetical protein
MDYGSRSAVTIAHLKNPERSRCNEEPRWLILYMWTYESMGESASIIPMRGIHFASRLDVVGALEW